MSRSSGTFFPTVFWDRFLVRLPRAVVQGFFLRSLSTFGLAEFGRVYRKVGINPAVYVPVMFLVLLSGAFEGFGVALLVPVIKGLISSQSDVVIEIPKIGEFLGQPVRIDLQGGYRVFFALLSVIFFSMLLSQICWYGSAILNSRQILYFQTELRKLLFNRYLSFGKLYFDKQNLGTLSVTLTTFVNDSSMVLSHLFTAFNAFVMVGCYLTLCLFLSWKFTLYSLILIPFLLLVVKWLSIRIRKISSAQMEKESYLNRVTSQSLLSIPLIKSYSMEKEELKRFGRVSDELFSLRYLLSKKVTAINPLQEVMLTLGMLALVAGCFVLVKSGTAQVSSFAIFFLIFRRLTGNISTLNGVRGVLAGLEGQLSRVGEMFGEEGKAYVRGGKETFPGLNERIEFRGVDFGYAPDKPVLRDLSFSMEAGKVTALVGSTGAGKSTIASLIMRFYDCAPEQLFVDGVDVRNYSIESLTHHMAYVGQDTILLNDSIRNNLCYGLQRRVTDDELLEVTGKVCLDSLLATSARGLDTEIGDRGIRLSGGERQRLAIARAVLKGSNILILDEATSSLDSHTERLIQKAISNAIEGKTAIVIAHRLSTIKDADKIIVVKNGQIAEQGTFSELVANRADFYQFWNAQNLS